MILLGEYYMIVLANLKEIIMRIGIIGALDKEVELIQNSLESPAREQHFGVDFYKGGYKGKEIVVCCCSIGKVNSAICACALASVYNVDVFINVGIAGGLEKSLRVLDVVISDEIEYYDIDREMFKRYHPFKVKFKADEVLAGKALEAAEEISAGSFKAVKGLIGTADQFINTAEVRDRVTSEFSILCTDMEGAPMAQVADCTSKPFLVIRTMSDTADDNADTSYDSFLEQAAENSAKIVLRLAEKY